MEISRGVMVGESAQLAQEQPERKQPSPTKALWLAIQSRTQNFVKILGSVFKLNVKSQVDFFLVSLFNYIEATVVL